MSATQRPENGTRDPTRIMWGFHVHQDLTPETEEKLPEALALQRATQQWLESCGVPVDIKAAFRPGYGPHRSYAWELRVERLPREQVLPAYGRALLWLQLNHGPALSGYIHPTMHDETLPGLQQLRMEGSHHKFHTVVLGPHPVDLNLDFFMNPPLNEEGGILNTRDTNEILAEEIDHIADSWVTEPPVTRIIPDDTVIKNITLKTTNRQLTEGLIAHLTENGHEAAIAQASLSDDVEKLSTVILSAGAFDKLVVAYGAAMGWLLTNRVAEPAVWPAFDSPVAGLVSGEVALHNEALATSMGEGALTFRVGAVPIQTAVRPDDRLGNH